MEITLSFIIIALIVWLNSKLNQGSKELKEVKKKLDGVDLGLKQLTWNMTTSKEVKPSTSPIKKVVEKTEEKPLAKPIISKPIEKPIEKLKEKSIEKVEEKKLEVKQIVPKVIKDETRDVKPVVKKAPMPKKEVKPTFKERHPDMERFIGENLMSKVGIGILVLGIAFFVKYAIDQEWIGEIGRVLIGLLSGSILVGCAHYLKKTYKAFSSILVGGGLAVYYFTTSIAFHEYHIISQNLAFGVMIVTTLFSVLLSLSYNRKELAVLALLGGFLSPFMVSSDSGSYIVLFSYILILNTGMIALGFYKKWRLVNMLSYFFTILLFGGWALSETIFTTSSDALGGAIFGFIFYLQFIIMNVIYNVRKGEQFKGKEFMLLLSNSAVFYGLCMLLLDDYDGGSMKGVFTGVMAAINFAILLILKKRSGVDKNVIYLFIGMILSFISLIAPVQLSGNHITIFWALEAVMLVYMAKQSNIKLMKQAAILIQAAALISWTRDLIDVYTGYQMMDIVFNKGFMTSALVIASMLATCLIIRKDKEGTFLAGVRNSDVMNLLQIAAITGVYLIGILELRHQLFNHFESSNFRHLIQGSYHLGFILVLVIRFGKERYARLNEVVFTGGLIGVLSFIIFYNPQAIELREKALVDAYDQLIVGASFFEYYLHFINIGLVTILTVKLYKMKSFLLKEEVQKRIAHWVFAALIMILASIEMDHIWVMFKYQGGLDMNHLIQKCHQVAYPLLWGAGAFSMMWLGMRRKVKDFRIISLSLFAIILLKLFVIDIRDISEGGKIAAFISLGVLLLIISFMYQKLKTLILTEKK